MEREGGRDYFLDDEGGKMVKERGKQRVREDERENVKYVHSCFVLRSFCLFQFFSFLSLRVEREKGKKKLRKREG